MAIAINQDSGMGAADRLSRDNATGAEVWSRVLGGGDLAVVLYNSHALRRAAVSVSWAQLNLTGRGAVTTHDVWANTSFVAHGELAAELPPRDVRFLRLMAAS
jgi:hypothetical protein